MNFDPAIPSPGVMGDPIGLAGTWRHAGAGTAAGVVAILSAITSLGGRATDEAALEWLERRGVHVPGGGTPLGSIAPALREAGLRVEDRRGASLDDIEDALIDRAAVLVAVADRSPRTPAAWNEAQGIPGHAPRTLLQVIGIDWTGPRGVEVIVNDASRRDGQALLLPEAEFHAGWERTGRRLITIRRPLVSGR